MGECRGFFNIMPELVTHTGSNVDLCSSANILLHEIKLVVLYAEQYLVSVPEEKEWLRLRGFLYANT